jgi:hypothetical protein
MNRKIWVTFQRKGFHLYPDAPDDVAYLKLQHRHLFKFKVTISVTHNEREIEFHQFQNWLESLYANNVLQANNCSCETLATSLLQTIESKYPGRYIAVEVSEDGECGAIISNHDF